MDKSKPWYYDDLERIFSSIYFASLNPNLSEDEKKGFARAIASCCLAFGINPERFLNPIDIQRIKVNR